MERLRGIAGRLPAEKANGWATKEQRRLLVDIFNMPLVGDHFFFAGGTALSAMYLGHRESEDVDIFTRNAAIDMADAWGRLGSFLAERGWRIETTTAQSQGFASGVISGAGGEGLVKVDLVFDSFAYEDVRKKILLDGVPVVVDNYDNLVVGKFSAFLSRGDRKDILDIDAIFSDILATRGEGVFKLFLRSLLEETKQRDALAEDLAGVRDIFYAAAERSTDCDAFLKAAKLAEDYMAGIAGDDVNRTYKTQRLGGWVL